MLGPVAVVTTFKAVVLEGTEVVFIVIAVGAAGNMLVPAGIGAAAAGVLVIALGIFLHRPLARVPENGLKFAVGIIISGFGIFWIGEGLGLSGLVTILRWSRCFRCFFSRRLLLYNLLVERL